MEREAALFALVSGDAEIAALVEKRIYPGNELPQGDKYPAVSFFLIDATEDEALDGPDGLFDARVQFTVLASDQDAAIAVRRALMDLLDGYQGTVEGFEVIHIHFESVRGIPYDAPTKSVGFQIDFMIDHRD